MTTYLDPDQARHTLCDIGRRMWQRGFCAGNEGNLSVRLGPDRLLCTPSLMSKGFLEPDDLCVIDMHGDLVEPHPRGRKRTSEIRLHLAAYAKRDDVAAVIHAHPPHATAFALLGIPLPQGVYPEAELFLGRVPVAPYATPGTPDLAVAVASAVAPDTQALLMASHGVMCLGRDPGDAYDKLEILDATCRILTLAQQLGRPHVLDAQQMNALLAAKRAFGQTDARPDFPPDADIPALSRDYFDRCPPTP
ncbi:MAG: class II aldolase/adducin family protein [Planctomycetota bacterium]